jgi:hypothetical protein
MITDAILDILFTAFNALFALFPSYTLPQSPGLSMLAAANIVLPIDTFVTLMTGSIAFVFVGLGVWLIDRLIRLIRG